MTSIFVVSTSFSLILTIFTVTFISLCLVFNAYWMLSFSTFTCFNFLTVSESALCILSISFRLFHFTHTKSSSSFNADWPIILIIFYAWASFHCLFALLSEPSSACFKELSDVFDCSELSVNGVEFVVSRLERYTKLRSLIMGRSALTEWWLIIYLLLQ